MILKGLKFNQVELALFIFSFLVYSSIALFFILRFSLVAYATMRDGVYFLTLAKHGYSLENLTLFGFFPGYPLTIRFFSPVFGYELAAVLVSILWSSLSVIIFYKVAKLCSKHPLRLSLLFVFIPYAWLTVSSMPQSDSQFMFFSLLTFYYTKTKRFPQALLSCAIASLTRLTAIAFMPFLLYESLKQGKRRFIPLVPPSFVPTCIFFLYLGYIAGNLFLYFDVGIFSSDKWAGAGRYFSYPGRAFLALSQVSVGVALKTVLIALVYALALWRLRGKLDLLVWSAPVYVAHLGLSPHPFFYFGLDRFLVPFFPVFFAYEDVLSNKGRFSLLISLILIVLSIAETYRMLSFFLES